MWQMRRMLRDRWYIGNELVQAAMGDRKQGKPIL
jgi:hypothetical protein